MPILSAILSAVKKDPVAEKEKRNVTAPGFKDLGNPLDMGQDLAGGQPPPNLSLNNANRPVMFDPMKRMLGR